MRTFSEIGTSYNSKQLFSVNPMSRLQATVYKACSDIVHFARPAHFLTNYRDMSRAFCTSRLKAFKIKGYRNAMSRSDPVMPRQPLNGTSRPLIYKGERMSRWAVNGYFICVIW